MTGIEIAVGYVFAWAVRKVRRVAPRADAQVDRVSDAALDRFDDFLDRRLGPDSALDRALEEVRGGSDELSDLTRRRLALSFEAAAQDDPTFEADLSRLVAALRDAGVALPTRKVVAKGARSVAVGGSAGRIITGDKVVASGPAPAVPLREDRDRPADQPSVVEAAEERAVAVGEDAGEIITGNGPEA